MNWEESALAYTAVAVCIIAALAVEGVEEMRLPHRLAGVDRIVVNKREHKLRVFGNGQMLKAYDIALGRNPLGPKAREGDGRTPEGRYTIDGKLPASRFHRALHISYPNEGDAERARRAGVSPGADIMIHGLHPRWAWTAGWHRLMDWTDGCIAVTNVEMEVLFESVPIGTPIEIRP